MGEINLYRSRFEGSAAPEASAFISSIAEDAWIFEEDIEGTEAHGLMLYEQELLSRKELSAILTALEDIRKKWRSGQLVLDSRFEDTHELIESMVIEQSGLEAGGKLHTGRSRNDQVCLDVRMKARRELLSIAEKLLGLARAMLDLAEKNIDTVMVLYTHLQHAQVGSFAHYLISYVDAFFRDLDRIKSCYDRVNLSPLGAGPIAGSSFPLSRAGVAELLGFDGIIENSIDAVSSRDFALETVGALAILVTTLSRIAEDFIIWSSQEFGLMELSDKFASPSSIMPQKKNPCTLELIRAKAGAVYGELFSLFTILKGLPTGYNRDLQQTKPCLWRAFDIVSDCIEILSGVISTMTVRVDRMERVAEDSYALALDLAETLVLEGGLPFREAHKIVGAIVREALKRNRKLRELDPKFIAGVANSLVGKKLDIEPEKLKAALDPRNSLLRRRIPGSPSPQYVVSAVRSRREKLLDYVKLFTSKSEALEKARASLMEKVSAFISESPLR